MKRVQSIYYFIPFTIFFDIHSTSNDLTNCWNILFTEKNQVLETSDLLHNCSKRRIAAKANCDAAIKLAQPKLKTQTFDNASENVY